MYIFNEFIRIGISFEIRYCIIEYIYNNIVYIAACLISTFSFLWYNCQRNSKHINRLIFMLLCTLYLCLYTYVGNLKCLELCFIVLLF